MFYAFGGGGGEGGQKRDWTSKSVFEVFPLVENKTKGHFLTQKESACQISADSKQLEKSQRNGYVRLSLTEPFNLSLHEY